MGVPESRLVLGKHSGRHALTKRCQDLGVMLTKEQLDVMYDRFTEAADHKKGLRKRRDQGAGEGRGRAVDGNPMRVLRFLRAHGFSQRVVTNAALLVNRHRRTSRRFWSS